MRKVLAGLLLGAVVLFSTSVYAKDLKIGYADMLKVFNEYEKTKVYEAELDKKKKKQEEDNKLVEKKDKIIKMQDKLALLKEQEQEKERDKRG